MYEGASELGLTWTMYVMDDANRIPCDHHIAL